MQELGNYLVAGRDLPPASLLLDEQVSVLGPAEQVWIRDMYTNAKSNLNQRLVAKFF